MGREVQSVVIIEHCLECNVKVVFIGFNISALRLFNSGFLFTEET